MTLEIHEQTLWLIPVGLAVSFMIWVLLNWWRKSGTQTTEAGITLRRGRIPISKFRPRASEAKRLAIQKREPAEVHALAAALTHDAIAGTAGQVSRIDGDAYPLLMEELLIRQFAIGVKLPALRCLEVRKKLFREFARVFESHDSDGAA